TSVSEAKHYSRKSTPPYRANTSQWRRWASALCGEHAINIPCQCIDLQVHTSALAQMLQGGDFNGMRNKIDRNLATRFVVRNAIDRQTDAIHGDRAFIGHETRQTDWHLHAQLP